jgi:integrase/recombinase XerD
MLNLYRRHSEKCPHTDIHYTGCHCPIWFYGTVAGEEIRESAKTRDWSTAAERIKQRVASPTGVKTLNEVIEMWLKNQSRAKAQTKRNYAITFRSLGKLAMKAIDRVGLEDLEAWRHTRELDTSTLRCEITLLRSVFDYARNLGQINANPIRLMRMPEGKDGQTMPLTPVQVRVLLDAIATARMTAPWKLRVRAAILLMVYSGLRIGDAVCLQRNALAGNRRLKLRTDKTGADVSLILHVDAFNALHALPNLGERFFWTSGKLVTVVNNMRKHIAVVKPGFHVHPHMFRDTFACELLSQGKSMKDVSELLGHSSEKTTERYYGKWVRNRQQRLDRAMEGLSFREPEPPKPPKTPGILDFYLNYGPVKMGPISS